MKQKSLEEILKSLTGESQISSSNLSKPKQFALKTLDAFDALAEQNAKEGWTRRIWKGMKWHVKNRIIPNKTDEQIRNDLKSIYDVIHPLFETLEIGNAVKEARELNSTNGEKSEAQKFIESNQDFKDALEVVEEL